MWKSVVQRELLKLEDGLNIDNKLKTSWGWSLAKLRLKFKLKLELELGLTLVKLRLVKLREGFKN